MPTTETTRSAAMLPDRPVRVLTIEDEPDLRRLLSVVLERAGYEVFAASDGLEGLRFVRNDRPDLVVLDIGLPRLDGWQVLARIRDHSEVPVLMLTARALEDEKVRALQAGADDYVTKPFGHEELVARVHALVRRAPHRRDPLLLDEGSYDDAFVSVDFAAREAAVRGVPVELTATEFKLLSAFVRHEGEALSTERLLELCWDDPEGIGHSRVKFAILRLRRKLGDADPETSCIEAMRGFGYRYRTPSGQVGSAR